VIHTLNGLRSGKCMSPILPFKGLPPELPNVKPEWFGVGPQTDVQSKLLRVSNNQIFRLRLGIILSFVSEAPSNDSHVTSPTVVSILRLSRAHSGNIQIQGTFREHSGNIQGTFSEHSFCPHARVASGPSEALCRCPCNIPYCCILTQIERSD
jgi:hypothetical protein